MSGESVDRIPGEPSPAAIPEMIQRAAALHQQGQLAAAEDLYRAILKAAPSHFDALHLLGVLEAQRKNFAAAVQLIAEALKINAASAAAHLNIGNALLELGRHEEALDSYDRALAIDPTQPDALANRGAALRERNRREAALAAYDRALAIRPGHLPALIGRGNVLRDLGRYPEALDSCGQALAIDPNHVVALRNRAIILRLQRRHAESAKDFARLLAIDADYDYARGDLLFAHLHCCEWGDYRQETHRISADVIAGKRSVNPFTLLAVSQSPAVLRQCAGIFNRDRYPAAESPMWRGGHYSHDRIRVAYLSADFHAHAIAYLMAGVFETHDASGFETTAISFGPASNHEMRTRLENSFSRFVDVRNKSDREIARLLQELETDIAVDLSGYTTGGRTRILAFRPAPIQVNFLGYPGTMSAEYIDYIIADRFVIPEDQKIFYTEKVVYLPYCYQPNDSKRRISEQMPTRREVGLPEQGFVFCSFNNNYKISPDIFDVWMRLLQQVDDSVLWLIEDNPAAARNLRRNAEMRGVAPERLVFAPRIALADHLARQRLADLFLDTLPYNAHTTASDALWAGLPLVTCAGASFAGRVAGSLLHAVGLPELITDNLADYEALALKLALDRERLAAIKAKLARNRESAPLFDTDRIRLGIESAYRTMWERHRRGEPPASFAVAPPEGFRG